MTIIFLDTGPLGLITNPNQSSQNLACAQWFQAHVRAGNSICIAEIVDYELRRELLLARLVPALQRLDALLQTIVYVPLTTAAMRRAAILWAQVRHGGQPTADRHALDGDMILAAQALTFDPSAVVATNNRRHLARVCAAFDWGSITP